jgi:murein L,D-transpeptidase YafK
VELGANWVGDKMQQGDKSTPEGVYRILDKKQNGQTRYHRAFLLDYPNEEDKRRFSLNKKNGTLEQDAEIGSHIEIHGRGGKGIDWTDGCIALTDSDMEQIFQMCPVGTRVAIVGSTKSLDELLLSLK